ncbi:SNF domain containing protein [Asbolus verrucosus]|uniref:SNF domain containing protein n=1 Tax=Asbolus verrucosus TaxID=1661398 RepID=A0A482VQU4_ASBVE|nr:SNF domain containing protein [Asbolus verrucosus]
MMVVCGVPMLYMELAVGQFTGRGPIGALGHLCPLLKGTGLGSVVISFLMSTYYSVIIAYGIYYFFTSFKAKQPWEDCSHRWNTPACWVPGKSPLNISKPLSSQTPAEQFYDKKVLQIGEGIEDFDSLRWELVACLLCAWVLVYFAIWKSIKSSAKVRYFTATLPFLLIIVFLAKSLTLEGPGLIFVVYPQAMAKMPAAQLWAVLFFFMLICLALNSQFAIVEVVVTSIQDGFPTWIKKNLMCHEILVLIICVVSLICGLPNVTQGGIYFFQLIDHYAASISIMYLAFFEVIAIAWFYGVWRLSKNVKTMTGRHPSIYFKFCWLVATPLLIFSVWVFCMIDYESPTYNNGEYHYPIWAIVIGWIISALSILCIPLCMICVFIKSPGETFMEKLKISLKSDLCDKCPKCEEFDCDCIIKEDEIEPMLVMHKPDSKDGNMTSVPFYIPLSRVPTVHKFDLEKIHPDKFTVNNVSKPLTLNIDGKNRHKVDSSKEDVIKNSVQNGTIPEEDRFQTDDLPDESTNPEGDTSNKQSEEISDREYVEYSSHLHINLPSTTNNIKPTVKQKPDEKDNSDSESIEKDSEK